MIAVVVGGAGGIGGALVKLLQRNSKVSRVVATWYTSPPAERSDESQNEQTPVDWLPLDVTDESSVNVFAKQLLALKAGPSRQSDLHLGLVINTVGVLHNESLQPEKSLRSFATRNLATAMETNCLPTLLLAQSLGPMLKSDLPVVFAAVSARVGSISDNHLGGWYSYRISKAALNMALRTLAVEWGRTHKNVCVAALHPGTTATALSEPFQKNVPAEKLFSTETTASYLLQVVESLDASKSGRFWAWDGSEIEW